jgi:hypothetical protein
MERRIMISALIVVMLLIGLVPAVLGCAEPPAEFEAGGTMERTEAITDPNPEMENGKMILDGITYCFDVRGTLEGTSVLEDATMVIDLASGTFTVEGQGTFTGTVQGKSGSYVFNAVASGQFTSPMGETGEGTGEHTIISGTGELANLRGSLQAENKWDKTGMTETYSGTLRFEK